MIKKIAWWLVWFVLPTYKFSKYKKNRLKQKIINDPYKLSVCYAEYIRKNNIVCLTISLTLYVDIGVIVFFARRMYDITELIEIAQFNIAYKCLLYIISLFVVARSIEIFISFLTDAISKLNNEPSNSNLTYGDRLKLAFRSYLELIVNFATFTLLLRPEHISSSCEQMMNMADALYFSASTITTLGYGDYSPNVWFLKILAVFQVLVAFSLIVVSFTIYTSKAISKD